MTTDIHEIIRRAIDNMDNRVLITELEFLPNGNIKVFSCYTAWLMKGSTVLNGIFKVVELVPNEYFVVEALTNVTTFNVIAELPIPKPFYFHGTMRATNAELDMVKMSSDKFPMIYCLEVFREVFNSNPDAAIERETSLRLFFLTENDFKNWITDDHYDNVINPIRAMLDGFFSVINGGMGFGKIETYTTINHVNFGTFTDNNGHLKNLFDDNLSGIELDVTIPILKNFDCSLIGDCN